MAVSIVTTSPLVRRYTLQEFRDLPAPPEGGHYELIAGVLYMVPPPTEPHNRAMARINRKLAACLESHPGLGELYVPRAAMWIEEGTSLEPDLMFIAQEHLPPLAGPIRYADFVIEGLSRETALYDKQTKADTYAVLKVRELWLVDHRRHEIEQRILEAGAWRVLTVARPGDTLRSHVPPGFTVNVAGIFEGLPRE